MGGFDQYRDHDGLALAALVRTGDVTARELLDAAIDRAERVDPALNVLSRKLYAFGAAMLDELPAGGAFRGVPFLLKDVSRDARRHRDEPGIEAVCRFHGDV